MVDYVYTIIAFMLPKGVMHSCELASFFWNGTMKSNIIEVNLDGSSSYDNNALSLSLSLSLINKLLRKGNQLYIPLEC